MEGRTTGEDETVLDAMKDEIKKVHEETWVEEEWDNDEGTSKGSSFIGKETKNQGKIPLNKERKKLKRLRTQCRRNTCKYTAREGSVTSLQIHLNSKWRGALFTP